MSYDSQQGQGILVIPLLWNENQIQYNLSRKYHECVMSKLTRNISAAPWSFIFVRKNSSVFNTWALDSSSWIREPTTDAAYCSCWGLSGSTSLLKTEPLVRKKTPFGLQHKTYIILLSIHGAKQCLTSIGKCSPYTACTCRSASPWSSWDLAHRDIFKYSASQAKESAILQKGNWFMKQITNW